MLCFCESASIQTSRLYDRTVHPSLCLQAGLNLTRPRLKGVSFRPCFKVSWVLSFFQEPTWSTRHPISSQFPIDLLVCLFSPQGGKSTRLLHGPACSLSTPSQLCCFSWASLACAVLATLLSLVSVCPFPSTSLRFVLRHQISVVSALSALPSLSYLFCLLLLWKPSQQLLWDGIFLSLHFLYIPSLLNSSSQSIKKFI